MGPWLEPGLEELPLGTEEQLFSRDQRCGVTFPILQRKQVHRKKQWLLSAEEGAGVAKAPAAFLPPCSLLK